MKSKVAAMVLAGGMLLPAALQATEPNPQVADAIAQIAARRAEKDAANQAAVAARTKGDANTRRWGNAGGGSIYAPGQAQR